MRLTADEQASAETVLSGLRAELRGLRQAGHGNGPVCGLLMGMKNVVEDLAGSPA